LTLRHLHPDTVGAPPRIAQERRRRWNERALSTPLRRRQSQNRPPTEGRDCDQTEAVNAANLQSLTAARARGLGCSARRLKETAARGLFVLAGRVARLVPSSALPALAWATAGLQIVFSPARARGHRANMMCILGASRKTALRRAALTCRALSSFGLFLLEFFKMSRMEGEELLSRFSFEALSEMDRALERGRGVIIVTSHIGNWEAGARALAEMGYRLHVVAGVQFSRSFSPFVKCIKERAGIAVVSPGAGEYRRLVAALRANEAVALVVDGDIFEGGVEVPFFGRRTKAPAGPARLALMTGASVVSTHVVRERPMQFRMAFRTLWEGSVADGSPQCARDDDFVRDLTSTIMQAQEEAIAEHVGQWCIFRPLWNDPGKRRVPGGEGLDRP